MATKGTLNLDCIASDPASRFLYGIASANNASTTGDYSNSRFVLVRSNASPTNLATLTWTVISEIDGKDYSYNYPTFNSVDCAANFDDAFAVFFRNPIRTTNPTDALPMGLVKSVNYDWKQIKGFAPYGWTSDRFLHMSYYTEKNGSPYHILMDQQGSVIVIGSVGYGSELHELRIEDLHEWKSPYKTYIALTSREELQFDDNFDYARQGFFASKPVDNRQTIINRQNLFYRVPVEDSDSAATCHIQYSLINKHPCAFQGPNNTLIDNMDNQSSTVNPVHYYLFSGERMNATYFGGIINDNGVHKIFTSEELGGRTYVEHIITQPDTSSNFSVHQNFHTVGGLIEGQEPFVVALTSAGLYQFTIFGPDAGKMEGPFKVKVSDDLTSLPQRVVRQMKTKVLTSIDLIEQYTQMEGKDSVKKKIEIGASVGSALVILIVTGFLVWRRKRRRRQQCERKEEEERKVRAETNSVFVGKHEVHSDGLIPESESSSFNHKRRQWSSGTLSALPRPDARLQNHIYQDQMQLLELSSHPRPNIITSVAKPESLV
ncbi:hypothetical protein BGZ96_003861 [Linnemannia gamsii]|uniref:Uncharacterized protein n=1 Tax=Linnemannia gamsii TaxID=64522 RepID=A0ABQ7K7V6_9FUNG|nr:hypothetical protein BGZ96_003861 [Linnemannia gamsii]